MSKFSTTLLIDCEEDLGITGEASSMWNQTVNQNPELSGIMKAFEKYIPFIVIVTVKCLFEHATGKTLKQHGHLH